MNDYPTNENLSSVVCLHERDCASVDPSDLSIFTGGQEAVYTLECLLTAKLDDSTHVKRGKLKHFTKRRAAGSVHMLTCLPLFAEVERRATHPGEGN